MDESRIADPSSALRRSDRSLPTRLSRAVSVVLHPLVMPLYVILLLVAGPTQLSYFPASVKFYLLWVTVLYTAVIPLLSVGLLRSVGRISSLAIDDRRERILPLAIGIVCYLLCAATVARIPSAMIVRKFMLAGACCELFCLAVTFYCKKEENMQKLWFVFILAYVLISTQQLSILWQMMTAHVTGT